MKLHEYQAKQLFAHAGIPIPRGAVATTPQQASQVYDTLKRACGLPAPQSRQAGVSGAAFSCNVKAQIHAGGRGKAGGVLVASSADEASTQAASLLGKRLVTKQTGPEGLPVSAVLLDERIAVAKELYLAITIDRFRATPLVLASQRGGMDIEEVAAADPRAMVREPIEIEHGLPPAQLSRIASALGFAGAQAATCQQILRAAWQLFQSHDASLLEINPLVLTEAHRVLALDAKLTIDDNALFRHPELAGLRDPSQEHPIECKASHIGISYVGLDGTIGCLVNGAGLAMATNDIIKLAGGSPANFLDVGGGANVEQVTKAFSMILEDSKVKAILVNIFGGIMRCDWIAQGLLNATQTLQVKVPIVVRLQGTNVEEGRRLLRDLPAAPPPASLRSARAGTAQAGAKALNLISVDELGQAAKKVVELANQ